MNEDDAKARIGKIEAIQSSFDNKLASLDKDLLATLLQSADTILANPKSLSRLLGQFDQQYHVPVLQQFGTDLLTIKNLNDAYFQGVVGDTLGGVQVNQVLFENVARKVENLMTDRFGITAEGDIVGNGLFDLFSKDTTVRRQVQQFAYGQKAAGVGLERFKKNMRAFIAGNETASSPATPAKGVWTRHYNTVAYDTYQQADRVAQQAFSEGLGMTAFLYLGGTIAGTRPFCVQRDGKCFLKSEIDKMGTPRDTYGGYVNKSIGYFSGKPTDGSYSAFISAGGYACRHHWSAISDREAMRRRPDLVRSKQGVLSIGTPVADPVPTPPTPKAEVSAAQKAAKLDLQNKTKEVQKLPYFSDYKAAVTKLKYKQIMPALNQTQAAVLHGYTSPDFYFQLNRYLRTKTDQSSPLSLYEAVDTVLNHALEKLPAVPQGLVYRGASLSAGEIDAYTQALKSNTPIVEKGFLSTTSDYNKKFRGNTEYYIQAKTGRSIDAISDSKGEKEILLGSGKSFRVSRVETVGGITEIYMDEL